MGGKDHSMKLNNNSPSSGGSKVSWWLRRLMNVMGSLSSTEDFIVRKQWNLEYVFLFYCSLFYSFVPVDWERLLSFLVIKELEFVYINDFAGLVRQANPFISFRNFLLSTNICSFFSDHYIDG